MPTTEASKPGRPSIIRNHPRRAEIELARVAGATLQQVEDRFGVAKSNVHRHMARLSADERAVLAEVATALAEQQDALVRVAARAIAASHGCSQHVSAEAIR